MPDPVMRIHAFIKIDYFLDVGNIETPSYAFEINDDFQGIARPMG